MRRPFINHYVLCCRLKKIEFLSHMSSVFKFSKSLEGGIITILSEVEHKIRYRPGIFMRTHDIRLELYTISNWK